MSKLGNVLAGVAGGIIGYFIPGVGPYMGFMIGYGIANIVDPIIPDVPSPGDPMGDIDIMTSIEGLPFPDILGTTKLTGNLLYYGNNRREEVTDTQDVGKSSKDYVTGYRYFLTWAMGMCLGPVDNLFTIYADDDVVWAGDLSIDDADNGEVTVILYRGDRNDLSGAEDSGEARQMDKSYLTSMLDDLSSFGMIDSTDITSLVGLAANAENYFGLCTFYFGTDAQEPNAFLGALMINEGKISNIVNENIPYRRQCWAYFHDCCIGTYNRCPTMKFVIRKAPECSFDV